MSKYIDISALAKGEIKTPLRVNFVLSKNLNSRIFHDIFRRFMNLNSEVIKFYISEEPLAGAHVYHYHRPQLEDELQRPAVITVHHDPRDTDPWFDANTFWSAYKQADLIICLNSLQIEDLAASGFNNTTTIPHGYDSSIFSKKLKKPFGNRKLNIGYISKRYERRVKGEVYLYELAERVAPEYIRFTLVGDGRSQDAAALRRYGFEVNVFEYLPYRVFGSLYKELDFLLMTSVSEGGPANIPEAVASSTPVLGVNCGMVKDLVEHEMNGIVLTGNIIEDFEILDTVFRNHNGMADRLFDGAHKLQTAITWDEVLQKHIEIYFNVSAGEAS